MTDKPFSFEQTTEAYWRADDLIAASMDTDGPCLTSLLLDVRTDVTASVLAVTMVAQEAIRYAATLTGAEPADLRQGLISEILALHEQITPDPAEGNNHAS